MSDIGKAVYETINPIIEAHVLVGDIDATSNFAVYAIRKNPRRTKEGVIGYQGDILVSVLHEVEDQVRIKSDLIIAALEALAVTTTEGVRFTVFQNQGYTTDYSNLDDIYFSEITFTYTTKN